METNRGDRFIAILDTHCPTWREARIELNYPFKLFSLWVHFTGHRRVPLSGGLGTDCHVAQSSVWQQRFRSFAYRVHLCGTTNSGTRALSLSYVTSLIFHDAAPASPAFCQDSVGRKSLLFL